MSTRILEDSRERNRISQSSVDPIMRPSGSSEPRSMKDDTFISSSKSSDACRKSRKRRQGISISSKSLSRSGRKSRTRSRKAVNEELDDTAQTLGPETDGETGAPKKLILVSSDEAGGMGRSIDDEPYYHGFMSLEECSPLLKSLGDFLVRKVRLDDEEQYAISVRVDETSVMNFLIKRSRSKRLYYVYGYAFKTIPDLIAYHTRNRVPLNGDDICIKKGVEKSEWQLFHEQVEITKKLGEGAFGEVWQGTLSLGVFRGRVPVAIKMLHSSVISTDERIRILREANLMLKLNHVNVIKFYGVAATKEPIMIVMELASGGSLLARVQDVKNPPTESDKVKYCSDVANGLAYLESMCVIHRDVAARNCLLGENETVKLSDFGLSLLGIAYREKHMKNVPIRWLAPETLKSGRYSTKSDVWSFGVTIWEIFSNGAHPYSDVEDNKEVRRQVLAQKLKLTDPPGMPSEVLSTMHRCLQFDPEQRPPFHELVRLLDAGRNARIRSNTLSSILRGILRM
uniref:Tyrosine-protein kinase n=1 Tax=Parascaris univalens TaxID=6257 RepID=A0A914ZLH4_PARUN